MSVAREAVETAREALEQMPIEREKGRSLFADYVPAPKRRLVSFQATRLSVADRVLLRDVSLTVDRDDKVWICGPNGAGKTTLLRALVESARLDESHVLVLPQELDLAARLSLIQRVRKLSPQDRAAVLSLVAALGVDPEVILTTRDPSLGEARKLALAFGLTRQVWMLVLDEPTHHLDLPSIERIEQALREFPGAILLVSHDERFAARLTNLRWRIDDQRVVVSGSDSTEAHVAS
ncbi:MAG: ATP-binding cassette domain-containing protein [Polyangiaceae bacterium]